MGGPVGAHTRTQEPEQRPPPGEGNKFEQRRPAPSPPPSPPRAGFRQGRRAGGGWDPSPQCALAQSPARASPGAAGEGKGESPSGRGFNPAAPSPPTERRRGTLAP